MYFHGFSHSAMYKCMECMPAIYHRHYQRECLIAEHILGDKFITVKN